MRSGNETDKESQFTVTWTRPGALDIVLGFGLVDREGEVSPRGSALSSVLRLFVVN